jgi:hypothetical protein
MATEEIRITDDALKILGVVIEAQQMGEVSTLQDVMTKLGLTRGRWEASSEFLFGYSPPLMSASLAGEQSPLRATAAGIEYYDRARKGINTSPHIQIGAVFQASVNDAKIQAVASAVNSSVQQVVENIQVNDIRETLTRTIDDMVQAVKGELTLEELAPYAQIARQFQQEIKKETPDKAWLRRAVSILSFMSDVEGTIQFGERAFLLGNYVAPYVPLLITLLARLLP